MSLPEFVHNLLQAVFHEHHEQVTAICDDQGVVQQVWGAQDFLSEPLRAGASVSLSLPEFTTHDLREPLRLPVVSGREGYFYSLDYKSVHGGGVLLVRNQTDHVAELQQKQQMAHDLALMFRAQSRLMSHLQASHERLAETERHLSETNRLKSQFMANLAHELKTPLTAILGYAEMMGASSEPDREHASKIERSARQLMTLLENLLDQNLLNIATVELHDVPTALTNVMEDIKTIFMPIASRGQLAFHVRHGDLPVVTADDVRLRQILVNLVGNALKFTKQGSVRVEANYGDNLFQVDVIDTGPGIPMREQQRIFQPYQRLNPQSPGAGLGLAIVKQLVETMSGELSVRSVEGEGSTFMLRLPLLQVTSKTTETTRQGLIGIAEDDPDIRDLIAVVLADLGYCVEAFGDGLELCEWASNAKPDMVITDLNLPRMAGIELIMALRQLGHIFPIVVLSASSKSEDRRRAREAGCSLFLKKPVHMLHLVNEVDRLLESHS
ncbi:MAG: response regulator [Acidobacteria bacterium]|nr:response regulator [Acidobacteriota bacterium]